MGFASPDPSVHAGLFYSFVQDASVRLIGVEAGGHGVNTSKHAATLTRGSPGVLHGSYSYLLHTDEGQVIDPHSISAGCVHHRQHCDDLLLGYTDL